MPKPNAKLELLQSIVDPTKGSSICSAVALAPANWLAKSRLRRGFGRVRSGVMDDDAIGPIENSRLV
jgi:hypothetical protein